MAWTVKIEWDGQSETFVVDGQVTAALNFFDSKPEPRIFTAPIALGAYFDVPTKIANGKTPDMALATVYRGDSTDDDDIYIVGRIEDPRWRHDHEARIKIVEEPWAESSTWPPSYEFQYLGIDAEASAELNEAYQEVVSNNPYLPSVVTQMTFSVRSRQVAGRVYPFVFGHPGKFEDGTAPTGAPDPFPGSPALYVNTTGGGEVLMAALGRVEATDCTLYGKDNNGDWTSVNAVLYDSVDDQGRAITVCFPGADGIFSGAPTAMAADVEGDYYIAWNDGASDTASQATSGKLGDLIALMLNQTRIRQDKARLQAYMPRLNEFRVDGYIDESVDIVEWLLDNLEPFPVRLVSGRHGIYPWVFDPDELPILDVIVGQNCSPDGDIRLSDQEPLWQYEIQYAHDDRDGALTQVATAGSEIGDPAGSTFHAELGKQIGGKIRRVESNIIQDPATAARCARARVRALSQRHMIVNVNADYGQLGHLEVGDPVWFTWAAEGIEKRWSLVTKIIDRGEDWISLEVTVLTDRATWSAGAVGENSPTALWPPINKTAAWIYLDPYDRISGNNDFTSTQWIQVADVSGNDRHATLAGGTAATVSAASYGPGGNLELPLAGDATTVIRYKLGSDFDLFAHNAGYCGPYMELGNQSEMNLHCRSVTAVMLRKVRVNSGTFPHVMTCGGTGGGTFSGSYGKDPSVTGDPTAADWTVYAWSATGGTPEGQAGSDEDFRLIWATKRADVFGGRVQIQAKHEFTTSVTLDNSVGFGVDPFGFRDAFRGLAYNAASTATPWGRAWVFRSQQRTMQQLIDLLAQNLLETYGLTDALEFYEAAVAAQTL